MALTPEEKQWVLEALNEASEQEKKKALKSHESFGNWLSRNLYEIYLKIKDFLQSLWQSIRDFFS
jgi:hypothetical protein